MAALDDVLLPADADVDAHAAETALDALDFRVLVNADAFRRQRLEHHPRKLGILAVERLVRRQHHDARAQPAVALREL
jgi:hypothetical protein